jgi:hypothetical protein
MKDLEKLMVTPGRAKKEISAWYYVVVAGFLMLLMVLLFGCKKDEVQTCKTCKEIYYERIKSTGQEMTKVLQSKEVCEGWESLDGKKTDGSCGALKSCYTYWECK